MQRVALELSRNGEGTGEKMPRIILSFIKKSSSRIAAGDHSRVEFAGRKSGDMPMDGSIVKVCALRLFGKIENPCRKFRCTPSGACTSCL